MIPVLCLGKLPLAVKVIGNQEGNVKEDFTVKGTVWASEIEYSCIARVKSHVMWSKIYWDFRLSKVFLSISA